MSASERFLIWLGLRKPPAPRRTAGVFRGARMNGVNADWVMRGLSADRAIRDDIQALRDRARELELNSAATHRIVTNYQENLIGKDGITLQAKVESTRGKPNDVVNKRIEEAWYRWVERETASMDWRRSWLDTETMSIGRHLIEGEFLLRHVRGADNPFGYATEVIDNDQLDHTLNVEAKPGTNEIRMGVEQNQWGRPVAYHLLKSHPSDARGLKRDYNRVPADEIIHLFIGHRPRQSRGYSRLAPVLLDLRMLDGYREAVLIASRNAASTSILFETDPDKGYDIDPETPAEIPIDIPSGIFSVDLPPGVTPHFNNPDLPNDGFDAFEKAILRSIASGVGISYAAISGDLEGTSYGSGRMGMLAERAAFQKEQNRLVEVIHVHVFREWLRMSILTGALKVDSLDSARYHEVTWHPRPFPWIDPQKDADAEDRQVGMGVQTRTRIANEKGLDYKQLIDEQADEIDYAKSKGVPLFVDGVDVTGKIAPKPTEPGAPNGNRNGKKKPDDEDDEENGKEKGNGSNGAASRIPQLTARL